MTRPDSAPAASWPGAATSGFSPPAPERDLFTLSGPVGFEAANDRDDVIRAQMLLSHAGWLDLPDGLPTGWPGNSLTRAIRGWQKDNGLTVDGTMLPEDWNDDPRNGETIRSLRDRHGAALAGMPVPTATAVDARHEQIARDANAAGDTTSDASQNSAPVWQPGRQVAQAEPPPPVPQTKPTPSNGLWAGPAADGSPAIIPRSFSANGIEMLTRFEKFQEKRYLDEAGHPTIGYGHRIFPQDEEKFRDRIDEKAARKLLADDTAIAQRAVRRSVKVDLSQSQFDALTSFAYNIGSRAFSASDVVEKLNRGDVQGAADELLSYDKITVNGRKIPSNGLIVRRRAERNLFLDGLQ